jgi:hypothetical protein
VAWNVSRRAVMRKRSIVERSCFEMLGTIEPFQ